MRSVVTGVQGRAPGLRRPRPDKEVVRRRTAAPYLFAVPFVALYILVLAIPLVYAIIYSLHALHHSGLGLTPPTVAFVGLENYLQAIQDPQFIGGIERVLLFGVVQIPIMLMAALALALLLDRRRTRGRGVFRTVMFLPYAVPSVVAGLLWSFMYVPALSPFTRILSSLGGAMPNVLSPALVLWAVANIVTWEWTGYNMIILTAALQAVSLEVYDAARIDGASEWAMAWRIKVPMIAPALVLTGLFSIVGTLQLFNEPEVLTASTSNVTASFTPNIYIYNLAFSNQDPYYSAAVAVILGLLTLLLSFGVLRLSRRFSGV
jgi:multiple sugar transport system permease protein